MSWKGRGRVSRGRQGQQIPPAGPRFHRAWPPRSLPPASAPAASPPWGRSRARLRGSRPQARQSAIRVPDQPPFAPPPFARSSSRTAASSASDIFEPLLHASRRLLPNQNEKSPMPAHTGFLKEILSEGESKAELKSADRVAILAHEIVAVIKKHCSNGCVDACSQAGGNPRLIPFPSP